jgi:hypothetical protein
MKIEMTSKLSGVLLWLEVRGKDGALKKRVEDIPNIILNNAMTVGYVNQPANSGATYVNNEESWDDLNGTWNQSGNTVTRATGTGTFPSSPSHISNEIKWNTGERSHVTARASDTSITVSGPARTITGGTIRRYKVNGGSFWGSVAQNASSSTQVSSTVNDAAGTRIEIRRYNFPSATSGYSLGSLIIGDARIKLPSPITIDVDDQIECVYSRQETVTGRNQSYELGSEATGIPTKYAMASIVGSGSNVDVTFSTATHFLAGDVLDLRNVTPKKFAISSATSNSTTFTINTTAAHGLSVSDSVVIEGASLAGYNGTFTVASVVDSDTITITNSANPGAMGASGTIRLATPGTYFDDLGLATIASMVSTSVARITSAITGPDVNPENIGGDPGVIVRYIRSTTNQNWRFPVSINTNQLREEAHAVALVNDQTGPALMTISGTALSANTNAQTAASAANDWTDSILITWNAGSGLGRARVKQLQVLANSGWTGCQITFNTPFVKTDAQRLRVTVAKQFLRDLP